MNSPIRLVVADDHALFGEGSNPCSGIIAT
jgi:hypothetical protein